MREHWLEHAHGRIVAGDDELDVLADYGWVQITAEEREAIRVAILEMDTLHSGEFAKAETLRKLLERPHA
jgi:hypothetical protein